MFIKAREWVGDKPKTKPVKENEVVGQEVRLACESFRGSPLVNNMDLRYTN